MELGWHAAWTAGSDDVTPDEERWAEALMVERLHGDRATIHVAERIGALALAGDAVGVSRWKEIAARLDQLRGERRAAEQDG